MNRTTRLLTTSLSFALFVSTMAEAFVRQIQIDGQPLTVESTRSDRWIVKSLVPPGRDPSRRLGCSDIDQLAREFLLFEETPTNSNLAFLSADIDYWCAQPIGERRLRLEFAARRMVLEAANQ